MIDLSAAELQILRELAHGLPDEPRPYAVIAHRIGLTEEETLQLIRSLKERGVIRRLAAVPGQGALGYRSNAMVVWRISPRNLEAAGLAAAAFQETSHVYSRRTLPDWPYNLYTMIHARSRHALKAIVATLAAELGAEEYRVLPTLREFTRRSPHYPALMPHGEGNTEPEGEETSIRPAEGVRL